MIVLRIVVLTCIYPLSRLSGQSEHGVFKGENGTGSLMTTTSCLGQFLTKVSYVCAGDVNYASSWFWCVHGELCRRLLSSPSWVSGAAGQRRAVRLITLVSGSKWLFVQLYPCGVTDIFLQWTSTLGTCISLSNRLELSTCIRRRICTGGCPFHCCHSYLAAWF